MTHLQKRCPHPHGMQWSIIKFTHIADTWGFMCSMEGECPAHNECQRSASRSVRPKSHQVSFTTSTLRLQIASEEPKAARLEREPLLQDQISTSRAGASHRTAASFSFLDGSSSSRMPSTAKQPGLYMSSAAGRRKGTREEFDMSYVFSEGPEDKGVVPLITVGSVFSIFKRRYAYSQILRQTCSQPPMYTIV